VQRTKTFSSRPTSHHVRLSVKSAPPNEPARSSTNITTASWIATGIVAPNRRQSGYGPPTSQVK
jgi:hypothetical protein